MNERNHNKGERQFIVQQRSSCIHNILMLIILWFILEVWIAMLGITEAFLEI